MGSNINKKAAKNNTAECASTMFHVSQMSYFELLDASACKLCYFPFFQKYMGKL
jgi:hypothetical protein